MLDYLRKLICNAFNCGKRAWKDEPLLKFFERYGTQDYDTMYPSFRKEIAEESLMDGNYQTAVNNLREYIREVISNLSSEDRDITALRFYDISDESKFKNILNGICKRTISIGKVDFNDALDPLLNLFGHLSRQQAKDGINKKWYSLLKEAFGNLRIACLCEANANAKGTQSVHNPLMWAHYANKYSGIAVEYSIASSDVRKMSGKNAICLFAPVIYKNRALGIDKITLKDSILLKSKPWSYENEYRIVYFNEEASEDYVPLKCKITAIYMGPKIMIGKAKTIQEKLKGTGILVHRMIFDVENVMTLKTIPL